MIIVDHDIIAQLFYVRRLINEYNIDEVRIYKMHLVWQLDSLDKYKVKFTLIKLTNSDTDLAVKSLLWLECQLSDRSNCFEKLSDIQVASKMHSFFDDINSHIYLIAACLVYLVFICTTTEN